METIKPQYIEIIVRGNDTDVNETAKEVGIDGFKVGSDDAGKHVYQIPIEWADWAKSRVFDAIATKFGQEAYFGLSLVSLDDLVVVDDGGNRTDGFPVNHEGVTKTKWVKKKMIIIKNIMDSNRDSKWLLVSGWQFDGRYTPPMVNFLDVKMMKAGLPARFSFDRLVRSLERR